jgi:hypothetical protein
LRAYPFSFQKLFLGKMEFIVYLEEEKMKKFITICVVLGTVLAVSSPALAMSVALVPDTLNVIPGSDVDVSVYMDVSSPITMAAISTNIVYDMNVFIHDEPSGVVKGALLTHEWDLCGAENDTLRVGGMDLNLDPKYEDLAAGSGMLFTFTLKVKDDAPTGLSSLTWGVYDGFDTATAGFDYGDKDGVDVILLDSEMSGASINVIPEPATICLLAIGAMALLRKK